MASGDVTGKVLIHSVMTGQTTETLQPNTVKGATKAVRAMQYSPMVRSLLATAYADGSVYVWDVIRGVHQAAFWGQHSAPATGVFFSLVNRLLLCRSAPNFPPAISSPPLRSAPPHARRLHFASSAAQFWCRPPSASLHPLSRSTSPWIPTDPAPARRSAAQRGSRQENYLLRHQ